MPPPLYYASLLGFYFIIYAVFHGKIDVNTKGGWYGTVLQAASAQGHQEIVQLLLDTAYAHVALEHGYGIDAVEKGTTEPGHGFIGRIAD